MITQPGSFPIIFLAGPLLFPSPPRPPGPGLSHSPSVYFSVSDSPWIIRDTSFDGKGCVFLCGPFGYYGATSTDGWLFLSCTDSMRHGYYSLSIKTETNKCLWMDVRSTTQNDQYTAHSEREHRNSFTPWELHVIQVILLEIVKEHTPWISLRKRIRD